MRPYDYLVADSPEAAVALKAERPDAQFIAGGTNQIDLMKMGVRRPPAIIDIAGTGLDAVEDRDDAVRVGALVSNTACAEHPLVREHAPAVSMAIVKGATQQIRNMASVGGNLLQSVRSACFYDVAAPCVRRDGMDVTCGSIGGIDRMNAILGTHPKTSDANPSDMAVAMMALGATVNVLGPDGPRTVPMGDFFRLPSEVEAIQETGDGGVTPEGDWYALGPADLITSVDLPTTGTGANQSYHKVRDRASYAFALISGAAALRMEGERIAAAHVAAGGVGTIPWRFPAIEAALVDGPATREAFETAAALSVEGARAGNVNAFKLDLLPRVLTRALMEAAQGTPSNPLFWEEAA